MTIEDDNIKLIMSALHYAAKWKDELADAHGGSAFDVERKQYEDQARAFRNLHRKLAARWKSRGARNAKTELAVSSKTGRWM